MNNIHTKRNLIEYVKTIGNITKIERKNLNEWVSGGNNIYDKPYFLYTEFGYPMDYITANRIHNDMILFPDNYKSKFEDASGNALSEILF